MAVSDADRAWDLMEKISTCMLATWDGSRPHARPMAAFVRKDENAIYFLSDAHKHKTEDISKFSKVCLAFADPGSQKYVSVAGDAEVTNNRFKIKELWCVPAKAWWDSADDPNIRLVKVTPLEAEYWDSPGTMVSYVKMAAAAVTGSRPDMGENKKVAM